MNFNVIAVLPQIVESSLVDGVVGRAVKSGLAKVDYINPRSFTSDIHKTVDDRPFGGGDGMVMLYEPLKQAITSIKNPGWVVNLSAQGNLWSDKKAREFSKKKRHYFCVRSLQWY